MAIQLTPAASQRVRDFLARREAGSAFRLGVKKTGCSGWGYAVDVADKVQPDDTVFDFDGVRVVVDADSLPLVDGTEVDFVRRGLNSEFVFRNPNAAAECGCGESFTTAVDKA
ncbi:MAG: iron-sulfur cluster assembly accessory protein [Lysobacteraceae bacterium]